MIKKTKFINLCDDVFWYTLYLLPIILYGLFLFHRPQNDVIGLLEWFNMNFPIITNNIILDSLNGLFGTAGVLPLIEKNSFIMVYFSYFISVVLLHLAVDFLLFIPRLCHKWMSVYTQRSDS